MKFIDEPYHSILCQLPLYYYLNLPNLYRNKDSFCTWFRFDVGYSQKNRFGWSFSWGVVIIPNIPLLNTTSKTFTLLAINWIWFVQVRSISIPNSEGKSLSDDNSPFKMIQPNNLYSNEPDTRYHCLRFRANLKGHLFFIAVPTVSYDNPEM